MAYDEGTAQRIRDALADRDGVSEKKMFGGIAFMLHGNMCVGVHTDDLMARVGLEQFDEAVALPGARIMDFTKRPMKGWITVEPRGFETDEALAGWVARCVRFVSTLPRK